MKIKREIKKNRTRAGDWGRNKNKYKMYVNIEFNRPFEDVIIYGNKLPLDAACHALIATSSTTSLSDS